MPLPSNWTNENEYRAQRGELIGRDSTIGADQLIHLPGYAPHVWLTAEVADFIRRAADPCPDDIKYPLLRQAFAQLMHEIWSPEHIGGYAGHFSPHDVVVEALSVELIVDCGEPEACRVVAVVSDESVLVAVAGEFDLGADYKSDRAILRALVTQM